MAESVITPIAEKIAGYLVAPIGRRLSYLLCYRSYTDKLHDKVQKLGKARDDTKLTVNEARQRGDEIRPVVQEWLNRVDEITAEAEALMKDENKSCFNGWYPNLKSRYLISREADKMAQIIVEIQNDNNFPHGVSCRVLPRNVTFKEYESFESRVTTLKKIMDALRDDKMKMIGVWGMGGVGKTTLVKQVAEQAKQDELFKTEVYIDVSWTRDPEKIQQGISDIQQKIADMLGLEFKNEAQSTKAAKLMQRLQEEKILIVLDDIWKEIDLEKVGIPCKDDQKDCKIVLASRDEDLLRRDMGAQECFPIQHLQEEEAWHLFKRTAGDSVEGDELRPIAIEVVNKCEGLPIAIVTIANALKDRSVDVWENALDELRSSEPANIRGVDDKVYGCLKWSYNHLNGDEVKSLFLLCGSLSYGDISMDHLLSYAMGLDSFDHIKSLKLARNKLVTLVGTLKASSLLLDSEDHRDHFRDGASTLLFMDADNKSVRMHDLVRDVARNIASKDPHLFVVKEDVPLEEWSETDESKYISLNCTDVHELPHRWVCPKLQFFLLQSNSPSLNIPDTFFEGMNLLKVLDLSKMHFTTLPSTLHSLANLRTLRLDRCELGDIALIGELKKLQVLSMVGSNIQQLPNEMVKLTNLRLLDLNDCEELEVIPRNILSSLSRLECLCMKSSFTQWAAEGVSDGESNACLSELNHLRHLTTIEIEVPAVKLLPKEDTFFQNLTRYAIFIGNLPSWEKNYKTSKTLKLKGPVDGSLLLRDGIDKLLKKTEELELGELEEVCRGPIPRRSFDNLKTLDVEEYHGLKFFFFLSPARGLSHLEEMKIKDCNAMQQIIAYERESEIKEDDHVGTNLQLFPKLQSLMLQNLPELLSFGCSDTELETTSQGMCSQGNLGIHMPFFSYQVSFPNLEQLELCDLPKLKEIWHHQLPFESFNNLQILKVSNCPCLLNLIPSHLIQRFNNLKYIDVSHCEVIEHVFDLQGLDINVGILPKLETLKLEGLHKLGDIICNEEKNDSMRYLFSPLTLMDFQSLECLSIKYCANEDNEEGHVNTSIEDVVLFGEKVSFSDLNELKLNGFPKLKMIWHHQLPFGSFNNLQILEVYRCPCLLNLIPSHLIQRLENLKKIKVFYCEVLEHVFDHQGLDRNIGILPKLETLELEELPRLRYIICKEDKNDNMRCLFSPPTLTDFQNLKYLSIKNCANADKEEGHVNTSIEDVVLFGGKASFSNLKKLELKGFPKLKEIWHHQLQLQLSLEFFYNLQILIVDDCPSLVNLVPSYLIQSFRNLEKINVQHCGVLEHVFDLKILNGDVEILPKLEILNLKTLPRLRHIICNEDKRCIFFPSTSKDFQSLKEVHVVNCRMQDKVNVNTSTKDAVLFNEKPSFLDGVSNDEAFDSCLEWSYTHLKGDDVKSLFLLCGMLGYGDISLDHLLQYGMGLDLFDRIDSLEQARNRLLALLEILKASSLLLDGHEDRLYFGEARPSSLLFMDADNKFVRMHDVVYDVARAIASKDPHPFVVREDVGLEEWSETDESKRCTFISLNCKAVPELPHGLVCPELQSFLLHSNNPSLNIPNTFFQGMKNLKVLDLSKMRFTTLPSSFDSLANLRTLRLDGCGLVDIALIGKLTKLEVLSLAGSTIQQLPNEMVQLTNLRLLDLNDCCKLEVIPRNILSSLSRLECLHMNSSFPKWAVEGESHACLSELNHLSHLTTLDIEIIDVKLLPKDILFENLTRYAIFMGDWLWVRDCKTKRALKLKGVNISLHLGDGINKLLERSEELEFKQLSGTKYVLHPSDRESFLELKHLRVSHSPEIQYIIDSKDLWFPQHGTFPLHNLEEVWHDPIPAGPFGNLKTLHVSFCDGLKFLFLPSTARGLSQLEEMEIQHCDAMQKIIAYERESEIKEDEHVGTNLQLFPKLQSLKLKSLPELINFYSELETTSSTSLSTNARLEGSFFNHQVSFPKLEELKLDYLPKLKNIWHHQLPIESHLIQSFQNLKKIHVQDCELLEHVIILQGIDENVEILPKLETLKLKNLPKLRWIEDGNDSMKYISSPLTLMNIQNLKELHITNCRMKNLWKM